MCDPILVTLLKMQPQVIPRTGVVIMFEDCKKVSAFINNTISARGVAFLSEANRNVPLDGVAFSHESFALPWNALITTKIVIIG